MVAALQSRPVAVPEKNQVEEFVLPPVTTGTIEHARKGVAYARDPHVTKMINQAFASAESLADGVSENKITGCFRKTLLQTVMHSLFRIKVENPERLPQTPALVVANHLNRIDPLLILSQLPASVFFHVLGDARSLYGSWWKRLFLSFTKGVLPLERIWKEEMAVLEAAKAGRSDLAELAADIEKYVPKGNSIEAMRRLDRIVQATFNRREGIMLFPEGRLGKKEGELLPLKRGMAIYALRSGVPIVPMALVGTKDLFLGKELTIRVGEPLYFPQSNRPKSHEIDAVLDEVRAAILALLPQDYTEPTGRKPFRKFLNNMFR